MKTSENVHARLARPAHTPGPWSVEGNRDDATGELRIVQDATAGEIAILYPEFGRGDADEANARLIAATPEMLAALKRALGWVPHTYEDLQCEKCIATCDRCAIQVAIGKAEGR